MRQLCNVKIPQVIQQMYHCSTSFTKSIYNMHSSESSEAGKEVASGMSKVERTQPYHHQKLIYPTDLEA